MITRLFLKPALASFLSLAFLLLLSSQARAVTIEVSNNGSGSDTTVNTAVTQTTTVTQTNTAAVVNNIDVAANTGDNEANDNTSGDVSIDTGNTNVTVTVANLANSNQTDLNSSVSSSNNNSLETSINVSGNGTNSTNIVNLLLDSNATLISNNNANVNNHVNANANTGGNTASGNTGGDVNITTGDSNVEVTITNELNRNLAQVDLCGCPRGGPDPEEPELPPGGPNPEPTPVTPVNPTTLAAAPVTPPSVKADEVLGAAKILPDTGVGGNSNWVAYLALLLIALGFLLRKKAEEWYYNYYNI